MPEVIGTIILIVIALVCGFILGGSYVTFRSRFLLRLITRIIFDAMVQEVGREITSRVIDSANSTLVRLNLARPLPKSDR